MDKYFSHGLLGDFSTLHAKQCQRGLEQGDVDRDTRVSQGIGTNYDKSIALQAANRSTVKICVLLLHSHIPQKCSPMVPNGIVVQAYLIYLPEASSQ